MELTGLDALLDFIDQAQDGTRLACFVLHTVDANLVGFIDLSARQLVGWATVPVELGRPIEEPDWIAQTRSGPFEI